MKVGICDDEKNMIKKVRKIVEESGLFDDELDIVEYNPESMFFDISENYFDCQILITDIYFGGSKWNDKSFDGVDMAGILNKKYPLCKIIFMSQYMVFAEKVYETDHIYFILKKNMEKFLPNALKKALITYREDAKDTILEFFSQGKKTFIKLRDIVSVEKNDRNIKILTNDESYDSIKTLKQFLDDITEEPIVRCNSSSLVNIRYIKKFSLNSLVLTNDKIYDIGETYKDDVKKSYLRWWKNRV